MTSTGDAIASDSERALIVSTAAIMATGPTLAFTLAALSPYIVTDVRLSPGQLGVLPAVVFGVSAPLTILSGFLLDKNGPRPFLLVSTVSAAAALSVLATAGNFADLLAAALLASAAVALGNPLTNMMISRRRPRNPGRVVGVKQAGVQLGQWCVGFAAPMAAAVFGWRVAAGGVAALVLLVGLAIYIASGPFYRGTTGRRALASSAEKGAATPPAPRFTTIADVVPLAAHMFLIGIIIQSANTYLPLYGFGPVEMSASQAGFLIGWIGAVGASARVIIGLAADRVGEPSIGRLLPHFALATGLSLLLVAGAQRLGSWALLLGTAGYAATGLAANVIVMLQISVRSRPASVGRYSALVAAALSVGFFVGPFAFGIALDMRVAYSVLWGLLALLAFVAASIVYVWNRRTAAPGRC